VRRVEAGAGAPAAVLEAGMNNGAASWRRVMPLLTPHVRGRHAVVGATGHNIPRNRPGIVADTILAVAAEARAHDGLAGT
jgi:hypothetical protein